ncbi:hypothetical protein GGR57DRAFT_460651 [Xylariaceae sp. FL1272]|nr:hypothetical protein GGR57DRAFT_460651 [Xylariaceae sp. FL1272]
MAGRRKRASSTSTVATIDQSNITHYKETAILKPAPATQHFDDWPCFTLTDAAVYHRNGTFANQLNAELEGPFIVRGILKTDKDTEQYLVNKNMRTKSHRIQIEASSKFSIACDESGSAPIVWASGQAGWFEIVPSQQYRPICDLMFQAVCLHFALLDAYDEELAKSRKAKKKKKDYRIDLEELLFKYALRSGDGLVLDEAYDRLDEQAIFVLSHFTKGTVVHNYLTHKFPDIAQKLATRVANSEVDQSSNLKPSPLKADDYTHRDKSTSLEAADGQKRPRGRPRNSSLRNTQPSQTPGLEVSTKPPRPKQKSKSATSANDDIVMIDPHDDQPPQKKTSQGHQPEGIENDIPESALESARVLASALQDVREEMEREIALGKQKKAIGDITANSWRTKAYMECSIKEYKSINDIFVYHAENLVRILGPAWSDTQIYMWAEEHASESPTFESITEAEILQLKRRVKKTDRGARTEKPTNSSPPRKSSSYAGKQTPRNARPAGKFGGLRPSTGSKKRLRHEVDFDDEMDVDEYGTLRKKPKKSSFDLEEVDEDDGEVSSDDNMQPDPSAVPLTPLVIRAEKLPSTRPQGPNHTWTCEEPDCSFVVRDAHEEAGQQLISAHCEEHDTNAREAAQEVAVNRVNLAVQEGTRGHMPINHLLEKIRRLGEKSGKREEINGKPVPEPIKRALII